MSPYFLLPLAGLIQAPQPLSPALPSASPLIYQDTEEPPALLAFQGPSTAIGFPAPQPLHRLSPVSACQPTGFPHPRHLPTPSYPRLQAPAELTSELGEASHKLHSSWSGVVTWSLAPDHSCLRFQTPLSVFHTWEAT